MRALKKIGDRMEALTEACVKKRNWITRNCYLLLSTQNTVAVSYMDSRKLFEYSQALRNRYLEQVASLPWAEVVESRGASFDCLRDILLHTIDAEDRLVNYVIPGRTQDWISRNPEAFQDIDSIRKRAKDVESKAKAYLVNIKA